MANLLDIRRRIRSVKNTRQITKAMQMVSAAKLRRAQERALQARPFTQMMTNLLKSLVSRVEIYDADTGEARNPLLERREERTALLIVVSGEKGLAGAFNSNILKAAQTFIDAKQGKNIDLITVGRKARDFFRRRYPVAAGEGRKGQIQIVAEYVGLMNRTQLSSANEISDKVCKLFTDRAVDSVYIVFNEFKSVISQRVVVDDVLPVSTIGEQTREAEEFVSDVEKARRGEAALHAGVSLKAPDTSEIDRRAAAFASAPVDYIYEEPPEKLFADLLPRYILTLIFRAMLESEAAEHAARMTAMDSATNNASDMIDGLTLQMNRVRQAKITKEIIEIVSGAAAAE
ncbi:MAG TPA: ATP synthase F1 subunit gamma [Candidatus Limnocylindrales bacterium]|nr:ATP synthase F1 subunit gamma [Candidatus Limnocylindrales bacterium]